MSKITFEQKQNIMAFIKENYNKDCMKWQFAPKLEMEVDKKLQIGHFFMKMAIHLFLKDKQNDGVETTASNIVYYLQIKSYEFKNQVKLSNSELLL